MMFCVLRWTWSFVFIFVFVFVFVCIYVLCFSAATDFSVNKDLYKFDFICSMFISGHERRIVSA